MFEYLILVLCELCVWLDKVEVVGLVFFGDYIFEVLGDYCSGINYVLFIVGVVCVYSGVSVVSF